MNNWKNEIESKFCNEVSECKEDALCKKDAIIYYNKAIKFWQKNGVTSISLDEDSITSMSKINPLLEFKFRYTQYQLYTISKKLEEINKQ